MDVNSMIDYRDIDGIQSDSGHAGSDEKRAQGGNRTLACHIIKTLKPGASFD